MNSHQAFLASFTLLLLVPVSHCSPLPMTVHTSAEFSGNCEESYELKTLIVDANPADYCIGKTGMLTISSACPNLYSYSPATGACHAHDCFMYHQAGKVAKFSGLHDSALVYDAPAPKLDDNASDTDDDEVWEDRIAKCFSKYVSQCYIRAESCPEGFVPASEAGEGQENVCYKVGCGEVPSESGAMGDILHTARKCVAKPSCPADSCLIDGECHFKCTGMYTEEDGYCTVQDMTKPTCPDDAVLTLTHKCVRLD